MKIVSINLPALRNDGYLQYMTDYLHFYETNDPVTLGVEDEYNALKANVDTIEAVYRQDQASDLTKVIADLDTLRDRYLIGISTVIKGYFDHYDDSKAQMAQQLDHRISIYGGTASEIARRSLQEETAALRNLLDDFQNNPTFSSGVTALGLTDWVGQLALANDNLSSAYLDRTDEKGDMPAEKIKDLRFEGNDLYYALREMMQSRAHIAGYAAPYDALIADLNALTEQYNQMMAQRGSTTVDPEDDGGDNDVGEE